MPVCNDWESCSSAICCLEEMGVLLRLLFFPLAHLLKLISLLVKLGRGRECFSFLCHCSFPVKTWQVSLLNHHWFTSSFIPSIPEVSISSSTWQPGSSLMRITGVRLFLSAYWHSPEEKKGEREKIAPCGCLPDTWDKVVKLTLELMTGLSRLRKILRSTEHSDCWSVNGFMIASARKAKEFYYWYLY